VLSGKIGEVRGNDEFVIVCKGRDLFFFAEL
jgi:hypothetical protein